MDDEQSFNAPIRSPRPQDVHYDKYNKLMDFMETYTNDTPRPIKKSQTIASQLEDTEAKDALKYLVTESDKFTCEYYTYNVCSFFFNRP